MKLKEFPDVQSWHNRLNELACWRDPVPEGARGRLISREG
jgi:hypothetical protein